MDWSLIEAIAIGIMPDRYTAWILFYAASIAFFAYFEQRQPASEADPRRGLRWPFNFGIGAVNILLAAVVPVTGVIAAQWALDSGRGLLNIFAVPLWLSVLVTVLARSLAGYLFHVLTHKVPLLWRLHRVHHSDTHLDVSTSLRAHPVEFALLLLLMAPLAFALGMNPVALALYEVIEAIVNVAGHSNFRIPERIDRALRLLFVTPNMHCLHHSSWHRETDSNYGSVLSVWDRLFRTYSVAPRGGYDGMQIGLKEVRDDRVHNFLWQLKSPALNFRADGKGDAVG